MNKIKLEGRVFELQGNSVLVKPDDGEKVTKTGIILPEVGKVKSNTNTGEVLCVGPNSTIKTRCKVYFPRKKASLFILNGIEYLFINEGSILYSYD